MANLEPSVWSMVYWLGGPGLRIPLIVFVAVVTYRLAKRAIPRIISAAMAQGSNGQSPEELAKRTETLAHVIVKTVAVVTAIMAVLMVIAELGLDIAPVLASVGVVGIAVGFGAQSLVKDVVNGLFILLENQFGKGDVVSVAGVAGLVEDVNLRRTVLRDLDGTVHSIPNGEIRLVSNLTREWSRVNLNISVAYGEDLDRVAEVINRVGRELAGDAFYGPLIVEAPQVLRVDDFEESGIAIKVLGVTKPIRQWEVAGELRKRIKKAFDEQGIEIPFPHRVVIERRHENSKGDNLNDLRSSAVLQAAAGKAGAEDDRKTGKE